MRLHVHFPEVVPVFFFFVSFSFILFLIYFFPTTQAPHKVTACAEAALRAMLTAETEGGTERPC